MNLLPRSLLPRVFLWLAGCLPFVASADPAQWADRIDLFTTADAQNPPPRDAVLFIGSSSIVMWPSLTAHFPDISVIQRGFGGSQLADSVFYADRIAIPYHPRIVVLYAGDNDIASGLTPEFVRDQFIAFREKIHAALPKTKVLYLSIKFSPSRAKHQEAMRRTNELIASDCAKTDYAVFVDVNSPMLDMNGQPRPELFQSDQLHMKPSSYALWTQVLAPLLKP